MLTQKVNKCPYSRTHRSVTVIHRTERHLYRQTFISHQLYQFPAGNLFIDHVIG
jgi:hypothetical protein